VLKTVQADDHVEVLVGYFFPSKDEIETFSPAFEVMAGPFGKSIPSSSNVPLYAGP